MLCRLQNPKVRKFISLKELILRKNLGILYLACGNLDCWVFFRKPQGQVDFKDTLESDFWASVLGKLIDLRIVSCYKDRNLVTIGFITLQNVLSCLPELG